MTCREPINETDQQILTAAVTRELGLNLFQLWKQYLSIGGNANEAGIHAYLRENDSLPVKDRDLLAWAIDELIIDSPWLPRAPYSETPLVLEATQRQPESE